MSISIGTGSALNYSNYGGSYNKRYEKTVNAAGETERLDRLTGQKEKVDALGKKECQTCKNRKYQDGSNDPGVSFKSAQKVSPERAASAVRSHEYEHVRHSRADAAKNGDKIVSQNVQIKTNICPECGRTYVSGGVTTTTTVSKAADEYKKSMNYGQSPTTGSFADLVA